MTRRKQHARYRNQSSGFYADGSEWNAPFFIRIPGAEGDPLLFYPKDMTSGCTSQACSFRDLYPQFREKGAVVLGVSRDSVASHKRFEETHGLPFTLLSDPELQVIAAYDVQKRDKDGQPMKGLIRSTYLIDENGMIVKAYGEVKAKENPAQMLEAL